MYGVLQLMWGAAGKAGFELTLDSNPCMGSMRSGMGGAAGHRLPVSFGKGGAGILGGSADPPSSGQE